MPIEKTIGLMAIRIWIVGMAVLATTATYNHATQYTCQGHHEYTCGEHGCENICYPLTFKLSNGQESNEKDVTGPKTYACENVPKTTITYGNQNAFEMEIVR